MCKCICNKCMYVCIMMKTMSLSHRLTSSFAFKFSSNLSPSRHLSLSTLFALKTTNNTSLSSSLRLRSTAAMAAAAVDAGMDEVQRRLMFDDECILVDENDRVVGHESKYNCHLMEKIESENLLRRAFSVFLFNSKYELLLQQRSATKVTFPLVWTNTCCSHPLYRDSELIEEKALGARNAAQRKLLDELGIPAEDVPVDEFTPLGRMLYKAPSDGKWGEHELDYLLFIVRDVNVNPNPDEVAAIKYVKQHYHQLALQHWSKSSLPPARITDDTIWVCVFEIYGDKPKLESH